MTPVLFFKAHVRGYTRRDGTPVRPHEDSRQASLFDGHGAPTAAASVPVLFIHPDQPHVSNLSNNVSMPGDVMNQTPITAAALGDKYQGLALLLEAIAKPGPIIKARYAEMRQRLARYFELAADVELQDTYLALPREDRSDWYYDIYSHGGLQSLKKITKLAEAHAGHPLADRALAYLREWAPIVAALDARKADVTTAAAQRDEAKKVREASKPIPSARSRDAMGKLAAAIDAQKPELAATFKGNVQQRFAYLVERYGAKLDDKGLTHKMLQSLSGMMRREANGTYTLVPAAVDREAQRYADAVAVAWKDKLDGKLESLDDAQVNHINGYSFSIDGERGGRKVQITQSMIVNSTRDGNLFNQFPARIYVDGKFMSEADYKAAFKA